MFNIEISFRKGEGCGILSYRKESFIPLDEDGDHETK